MKIQLALSLFALAAVMVFGQESSSDLYLNSLRSYGTGVVLVPIDRAAITVTATGMSSSAAQAVADSNILQGKINDTLRNYTIIDIRNGGLYLQPLYTGSSLSFAAHTSLSIVVYAVDTPAIIDAMVALGASNISFVFTPDFYAVETAQRQSLQMAVVDALYKAQAVLDILNHCAYNITRIAIRNPALELPSLTFNLFANMGNMNNMNIYNAPGGSGMNQNLGKANSNNQNNLQNNPNARPMMLGAAAPLIEGDREEVVSYVELYISHDLCSTHGSGMLTDLTSSLDLSNIVGIAGGTLQAASPMSSSGSFVGSSGMSGSGNMAHRSVRSTMW